MIVVTLNEANFEYDIHSLVKAFYPGEEVQVVTDSGTEKDPAETTSGDSKLPVMTDSEHKTCQTNIVDTENSAVSGSLSAMEIRYVPGEESGMDRIDFVFLCPEGLLGEGTVSVNLSDRKETKNRLKRRLYELLQQVSGQTLPWGTLTGIRPTKIPMGMLEENRPEEEIRQYMTETYFTSEEKIDLSLQVARRELSLLSHIDYEDGYSLYVGIPFCPSTCLYCSFTSYPISKWKKRIDEYLDALEKEICYTAETFSGKYINSIYIGGGTPTSLEPEQLNRLITMIGENFHLFDPAGNIIYGGLCNSNVGSTSAEVDPVKNTSGISEYSESISAGFRIPDLSDVHPMNHLLEFTVEAGRPDSITAEKLQVLKDHNISRISINPQTMKEETLRLIGRHHTVQDTREAFALARSMGFDNINMDLILGLPEETMEDVARTMEELKALGPDNITIHSLAIKRAARLNIEREQYQDYHMVNTWDTIRLTAEACRNMGLTPYYLYRQKNMAGNFENVGYAAPGKAGIYNILIMEEKQTIMALGAGATTKVVFAHGTRMERAGNVKDITNYLDRVDEMIARKEKLLKDWDIL